MLLAMSSVAIDPTRLYVDIHLYCKFNMGQTIKIIRCRYLYVDFYVQTRSVY